MRTVLTFIHMLYLFYYLLVHVLVYKITFCCLSFALILKCPTWSVHCSTFVVTCFPSLSWLMRHHALSEQLVKTGHCYHFYTLILF